MEATFIKQLTRFKDDARLYELSEPYQMKWWGGTGVTKFVVVSGAYAFGSEPETYIFAADSKGNVTSWTELPGSFRGAIDHEQAITGLIDHAAYSATT